MKTITTILLLFAAVIFSSCEGPVGPVGPPGADGDAIIGTVFEIEDDFTPANNHRLVFNFPGNFTMYDTDIVLVYMLWEVTDDGKDGWRLMPQTVVLKEIYDDWVETDVLQYNFDYTFKDVQIFLEGTVDFSTLLPGETNDQVFRIVVLPADFAAKANINNFDALIKSPELSIKSIEKIDLQQLPK